MIPGPEVARAGTLYLAGVSVKVAVLSVVLWTVLWSLRNAAAAGRRALCGVAVATLWALGRSVPSAWSIDAPLVKFSAGTVALDGIAKSTGWTAFQLLFTIWVVGAMMMLLRAAGGWILLWQVRRDSILTTADGTLEVRIAKVSTPVLIGMMRPVILVPAAWEQWNADQRRMVLAHERQHFIFRDAWINLLAQLWTVVLWFHPVVWLLAARLSREQELACDEAVVASGIPATDYASFLIECARGLRSQSLFTCSMAGSGSESMRSRMANLLRSGERPSMIPRTKVAGAVLAIAILGMTFVRPVWSAFTPPVYRAGGAVGVPRLLRKIQPEYTQAARDAKISGTVVLSLVVAANGRAENVKVVRSLDPGLDRRAMEAVAKWEFEPGKRNGAPVAVRAMVEVRFRLI